MTPHTSYRSDTAPAASIETLLTQCDAAFVPPLSSRVELGAYATKMSTHALRLEAWGAQNTLVGLLAVYCNDLVSRIAHLTNLCVLPSYARQGIAGQLMAQCIQACSGRGMREITLEVSSANNAALRLYGNWGFEAVREHAGTLTMRKSLQDKELT